MERQGCFVWDRAALCVRTGVCVCCGGLPGSNHQKKSEDGCDFFCGRLDKLNRALEGPLNDESMRSC